MRETSGKHGEEVDEEESSSSSNNTLGAADSLLLCLSILRERKKERERSKRDLNLLSSLSFPPKRQESTDERDKNRTTNVSILLGLDTLNVFLSFGLRKRLRRRTKRYAPGDDFDDESGFFVFLFFFEKQRLH